MEEAKKMVQAKFNTLAEFYDHPANSYWERFGRRTVERLGLYEGCKVLDVACGSGASSIPAAQAVGSQGEVIGIDLADNLLTLAREKARATGLKNTAFRVADMTKLEFSAEFDAIICVFGIFFVPMEDFVFYLWKFLKPGGTLAITTWGPDLLEPLYSVYCSAVESVRPDLSSNARPWDKINTPDKLKQLLAVTGAKIVNANAEDASHAIESPDTLEKMVMGSGLRGSIEAMSAKHCEIVLKKCSQYIQVEKVKSVTVNVVYGTAIK